jgi:coenzyme F420-reducing hydrogenase alpha subunit
VLVECRLRRNVPTPVPSDRTLPWRIQPPLPAHGGPTEKMAKEHRKKLPVKASQMANQYKKLREDGKKMVDDREKEVTYESGMMGPGGGGS